MTFSKRQGIVAPRESFQSDSIDADLRNGLWNTYHLYILGKNEFYDYREIVETSSLHGLFLLYWHDLFKLPLDEMPDNYAGVINSIRSYFHKCEWNFLYDLIEFTAIYAPEDLADQFKENVNIILEREQSAYRFIGNKISSITSEEEIAAIEDAIENSPEIGGVNAHLESAVGFLSDRKSPDYRNSIKESISAVESLCKKITGKNNATLGEALKHIEEFHEFHPALKRALSNLYGYTSDSKGIRHALLEESEISYSDAKFMLVSCSAFINYMNGKLSENPGEN